MAMGVKTSHVIKFIRKGDDGKNAVRYWLVSSTTSVAVPVGGGQPAPSTVSCAVMKQIGDNAPAAITDLTAEGLALKYYYQRAVGRQSFAITYAGPVEVSANESFRSLCFELHSGAVLIDTASIAIMRDGKPGAPGGDGEDAVIYRLVPSDSMIAVRDFDGESGNVTPGILMCSVTRQAGTGEPVVISPADEGFVIAVVAIMPDGHKMRRGTYDEENGIDVSTYPTLSGWELQLWHEESQVLFDTVTVPIVRDGTPGKPGTPGGKGDRGPVLRGPQDWKDCADGYPFESGAEGEQWQDVVIYDGQFYSCEKSHTKSFATFPNSPADGQNHYWQLATKMDIIATKILLSTYALVKNLGVEIIDMRDADGNILFQAKDGNVTCKTGDFENVRVSGDIRVKSLRHIVNPSDNVITSAFWCSTLMDTLSDSSGMRTSPYLVFPHLAPGEAMETTVVHFPNQAYCDLHNDPEGWLTCIGEGYDKDTEDWDGVVAFLTKREMTASLTSRAGTISGLDPTPPQQGGDIFETVGNRYYGVEPQSAIIIRGVWKFYGLGVERTVTLPDGTEKNATLWVAVELQSA